MFSLYHDFVYTVICMRLVQEFKEFAVKGNAIDMAVGIVIGTAFGGLVKSLVDDILMPPIGMLISNVDIRDIFIPLSTEMYPSLQAAKAAGVATINIGIFLNTTLTFLLMAVALFFMVKTINRLKRAEVSPTTKLCPECKSSINIEAKRCPECTSVIP